MRAEPDWYCMFEDEIGLENPTFPRYQAAALAFETVLTAWRRYHWTAVEVEGRPMRRPAPATDGIIALARIGVMPPRHRPPDFRGGPLYDETKKDPSSD